MSKYGFLVSLCLLALGSGTGAQPKYEFRAAWIATVTNIDWPSAGNYSMDTQKEEFINLLNLHQRNGLNAVIVQVRPSTDAFYPSPLEPWSEWLTGKQGRPPVPYYDPLAFMISETHKRGMEFHAWCNPYRAQFNIRTTVVSPTHVTRMHPEWFLVYGNTRYFDPGNKEVQQYVTTVVRDLVKRYEIDAVHFDDYFYPYRLPGKPFPDDDSYEQYGNGLSRDDWRRSNVDSIIVRLSAAIKLESRYCKFGISPFGVWRNSDADPEGSATKGGQSNYDDLYADILLWLRNGWIDYVTPQLYWEFSHRLVPYGTLIDWWSKHAYGRHLYIGHGLYKATDRAYPAWKRPDELPNQINALRAYPTVQGSAFYSSKAFLRNPNGWNDSLRHHYYRYPAIVPPMPWIDTAKPARPLVRAGVGGWRVATTGTPAARYYLLYSLSTTGAAVAEPAAIRLVIPVINGEGVVTAPQLALCGGRCFVTAVSRGNVESDAAMAIQR